LKEQEKEHSSKEQEERYNNGTSHDCLSTTVRFGKLVTAKASAMNRINPRSMLGVANLLGVDAAIRRQGR
jgi:hypothetical protein